MRAALIRPLLTLPVLALALPAPVLAQADEIQIATATLPLPEAMRANATVIGWSEAGERREIRTGSNGLVCVADEPGDDRFRCACYPESLGPLLSRSRELREQGVEPEDRDRILEEEVRAGRLSLPGHPTTLHVLSGPADAYDAATGALGDRVERLRIIFTPYETAEQMGLPTESSGDMPWVMASGKLLAHIMIVQAGHEADAAQESVAPQ